MPCDYRFGTRNFSLKVARSPSFIRGMSNDKNILRSSELTTGDRIQLARPLPDGSEWVMFLAHCGSAAVCRTERGGTARVQIKARLVVESEGEPGLRWVRPFRPSADGK